MSIHSVHNNFPHCLRGSSRNLNFTYKDLCWILLLYPLFFFYVYLDTQSFGFSIDIITKTPVISLLFFFIAISKKNNYYPLFFVFGILFSVKQILIIPPEYSYYLKSIQIAAQDLFIPLFALFFLKFLNYYQIQKVLLYLVILLILSTIPYHFGLINPLVYTAENAQLSTYGAKGFLFMGPFPNIHAASITLSMCVFTISFFVSQVRNRIIKILFLFLIVVGLYGMYLTYVRTGMVILLVALFVHLFFQKTIKEFLIGIIVLVVIGVLCYLLYLNSQILQYRLANTNIHGNSGLSVGSGRLFFWSTTISFSVSNGIISFLVGVGREAAMDNMYLAMGKRLFAHNSFVDVLVSAGVIGLLFFILYLRYLYKRIFNWRNNVLFSYKIVLIIGITHFLMMIFQSHYFFWTYPIIAGFVILLEKEYIHYEETKMYL